MTGWIGHLKSRIRASRDVAVFVGTSLALGIAAWVLFLGPRWEDLSAGLGREHALRAKVDKSYEHLAKEEALQELARRLDLGSSRAAGAAASARGVAGLASTFSSSGLRIERLEVDDQTQRRDGLEVLTAQFRVSGSFAQFARLVESLAEPDGAVVLNAMNWSSRPNRADIVLEGSVGLVRLLTDAELKEFDARVKSRSR